MCCSQHLSASVYLSPGRWPPAGACQLVGVPRRTLWSRASLPCAEPSVCQQMLHRIVRECHLHCKQLTSRSDSVMSRLRGSPRLYLPPLGVRFAATAAANSVSSSSFMATPASSTATDADDDKDARISAARSSTFAVSAGPCTHGGQVKVVTGVSAIGPSPSELSQRRGRGLTTGAMAAAAAEEMVTRVRSFQCQNRQ